MPEAGAQMMMKVLWSAMKGRVVLDGQPAAGAVLVREATWHWSGRKTTDTAIADAFGGFGFPRMERLGLLASFLPHEPVIEQYMSIHYQGKTHDAWAFFKRDYDIDSEHDGKPLDVTFRLGSPPVVRGKLTSLCEFY